MVKLLLRNFCWWCAPRSYQEIYSESKNSPISSALAFIPRFSFLNRGFLARKRLIEQLIADNAEEFYSKKSNNTESNNNDNTAVVEENLPF